MLATIALDTYRQADAKRVAEALDVICHPTDSWGWASSGVYAYWDVASRQVLYLGLATTLPMRFRQHNGLARCVPNCCKRRELESYFRNHDEIGFSVAMQSPMGQPSISSVARDHGIPLEDATRVDPIIQEGEGAMIEAYRQIHGRRPDWNTAGGGKTGRAMSGDLHRLLLSALTGSRDSALVAKATIRDIAADPLITTFESYLHAARMDSIGLAGLPSPWDLFLKQIGVSTMLNDNPDVLAGLLERHAEDDASGMIRECVAMMHKCRYFDRRCPLLSNS